MFVKNKTIMLISMCLVGSMMLSACKVSGKNTAEATDGPIITAETSVEETQKEPTETVAITKPIAKTKLTPTVKETTATTMKVTETATPVTTTKAPVATTAAPAATTAATTAAPTVETSPPQTAAPAYAENCDNIKNLVIAQLQAKGLWYPDAEVIGNDSKGWTLGYGSADEQYATSYVNGKYGTPDGTGATSVSAWIEAGYLYISSTKCALPAA